MNCHQKKTATEDVFCSSIEASTIGGKEDAPIKCNGKKSQDDPVQSAQGKLLFSHLLQYGKIHQKEEEEEEEWNPNQGRTLEIPLEGFPPDVPEIAFIIPDIAVDGIIEGCCRGSYRDDGKREQQPHAAEGQ